MNERYLRLLRSVKDNLDAIQKEIHATRDQREAEVEENEVKPPIVVRLEDGQEAQRNTDQYRAHRLQKWNLGVQIALCVFTLGAFGAAAYYARVAYQQKAVMEGQLTAVQESNRLNKEALETVQRAFIKFESVQGRPVFKRTESGTELLFDFHAEWKNTGNTPAISSIQSYNLQSLTKEPDRSNFIGSGTDYRANTIGPGGTFSTGGKQEPQSFFQGTFADRPPSEQPRTKFKPLFVWGWVAYRDVFEKTKPHVTEFCEQLATGGMPTVPPGGYVFDWITCHTHNCVDQYCKDYDEIVEKML